MNINRREFAHTLGIGLAAPAVANSIGAQLATPEMYPDSADVPYQLSVMLWTVLRDLPFEQRLEKVARAGYRNV